MKKTICIVLPDGSSLETLCKGVCDDCVLKYMCLTTKDDYINIGAIDIVRMDDSVRAHGYKKKKI